MDYEGGEDTGETLLTGRGGAARLILAAKVWAIPVR